MARAGNGTCWVYAGILLLAAGLRLWHIAFDLPEVTDVDAGKFVDAATHVVKSGELRPYDFQYPGGYIYALAGIYKLSGFSSTYETHLIARLLSVAGGLGMVAAAGLLARRFGGHVASSVAMLLTAISVECVTLSHVACTDTLTACFVTLALVAALPIEANWRHWLWAGACVGLAAGTKFSGACVAPAIVLAALVDGFRRARPTIAARNVAIVGAAAACAFLVTTPRFPLDAAEYIARLRYESAVQRYGQLGHVQLGRFDYLFSRTVTPEQPWLSTSLWGNAGPFVLIAALLAVVAALAGRAGWAGRIVALYIFGYLVLISGPGHLKATRFLLLILPALFALVGWLVEQIARRAPSDAQQRVLAAFLAVALAAWPAWRSCNYLAILQQPSTNTLAREWVRSNLPKGTSVFASPFYFGDLWTVPDIQPLTFDDTWERQYRLPESIGKNPERTPFFMPEFVDFCASQKIEYFVLNSYFDDALAATPENLRWFPNSIAGYEGFRARLDERAEKLHEIPGYAAGRSGPDITIYRLRQ